MLFSHNHFPDSGNSPDIFQQDFLNFIIEISETLLIMAKYIIAHKDDKKALTRPFLGRAHLEAAKIEEQLDAYGALKNKQWYGFRKYIAAIKSFSEACYICLHIKYGIARYKLLLIEKDFYKETDNTLTILYTCLANISRELLLYARNSGIPTDTIRDEKRSYDENLLDGYLCSDRQSIKIKSPGQTVVSLATRVLHLSEETKLLNVFKNLTPNEYETVIPDKVSEDKMRLLENRFHNLQSLYDTYISDSNIESVDTDLPIMRGHVTLIYHLLQIATQLSHYYERHFPRSPLKRKSMFAPKENILPAPIKKEILLSLLLNYAVGFSEEYLKALIELCRNMIKKYAEQGNIDVPVPNYRGFHVRPSTLVARIVAHYGSDVFIEISNQKFNAANPLEIFRVNEEINAKKRKSIAQVIASLDLVKEKMSASLSEKELKHFLRKIFLTLLEQNKIILYESNFSFDDINVTENETISEFAKKAIAEYMALGRIDINTDITVKITGDKRVLQDIQILAENGYGEDTFGNNVMLPKELSYLKR